MAELHFAEIDGDNKVLRVVVIDPSMTNPSNWLKDTHGGDWVNVPQKNAGIGFEYIEPMGKFVSPQPYPSWTLSNQGVWEPPVPRPSFEEIVNNGVDGADPSTYIRWDEDTLNWVYPQE